MTNDEKLRQKEKYKTTRKMAWLCLYASIAYPVAMLLKPELQATMGEFLTFTGVIVTAYLGVTNARDGWGKQ